MTRKDYMDGRVTHADYYRSVAKAAGISYASADPAFLGRVRSALANGDEHLNTIPLAEWDRRGSMLLSVSRAFKAHGDCDSLAGRVCVLKQAARDAVEAVSDAR
jgi:hypothetical protein